MALIQIEHLHGEDPPFKAKVSFDGDNEKEVVVGSPFDAEQERELRWYFEERLRYPYLDEERANRVAASLTDYGHGLFAQLFRDDGYADYKQLRTAGLGDLRIEVIGPPSFHRLHWEALKDPALPKALALEALLIRRHKSGGGQQAKVIKGSILRILVVTSRPFGRTDVGYRTITRPLMEVLKPMANARIIVDQVRPGTWEALKQRLEDARQQHGEGYYQVLHFDVHGAVLSHDELKKTLDGVARAGRLTFTVAQPIEAFTGRKAYLFFESEQDGQCRAVDATELAGELTRHQIPLLVLNACQSGVETVGDGDKSESSLAARLAAAGALAVVAMAYSVTVTAARLLMKEFYLQLASGTEPMVALRRGRQRLEAEPLRQAFFNRQIGLRDWVLPVAFLRQSFDLQRQKPTAAEEDEFAKWRVGLEQVGDQPYQEPTYGFLGRDLDLLRLERCLLFKGNSVLLQGMGGAGKTSLLRHAAWWWKHTGLVRGPVFYFGYDTRAHTASQILADIAGKLKGPERLASFTATTPAVQRTLVTGWLAAAGSLVILDNLESITGTALSIRHELPPPEREQLRLLLAGLKNKKGILVLLGSRENEPWLAPGTFEGNRLELGGLDAEAASELAQKVLARHRADRWLKDPELERLLKVLDGYPLALEVLLPNLKTQPPTEVLAGLNAGEVNLAGGDAADKTRNILTCVEYSFGHVAPEDQRLLVALAPFSGVVYTALIPKYIEQLRGQPELADEDWGRLPEVLNLLVERGLARPHEVNGFLALQPVLPYALSVRLAGDANRAKRTAVETAFCHLYDGIGGLLSHLLGSKVPQERQVGFALTGLEYENLVRALELRLQRAEPMMAVYQPLSNYIDATHQEDAGLRLGEKVLTKLDLYPPERRQGEIAYELVNVIDNIAKRYLLLKRWAEAETGYRKAVELLEEIRDEQLELRSKMKAVSLHQLGVVKQKQRLWAEAEGYYRQALEIKIQLNDRYSQASTYHCLGIVKQVQRLWAEAEGYYRQALEIKIQFNDRYRQASTYSQLGAVKQDQRLWAEAEGYYQQALEIYIQFNDRHSQAGTYHNLGIVKEEQRLWAEAEGYYQQALEILIPFNDRHSQASTYHQLGMVKEEQRLWAEAEGYYQQALEIYIQFNDRHSQANSYHQLGRVKQKQRLWAEAEGYYQQALEIYIQFNDRFEQAGTYHQLGIVKQEQRLWAEAEGYYQQALEIYIQFNDRHSQANSYHQLGIVKQEQRLWAEAEGYYQQALEIKIQFNDRHSQANSYHQLGIVKQEQRLWAEAEGYYQQALEIKIEFNDRHSQASTYGQLGAVKQEQRLWAEAEGYYEQALEIFIQFNDRHSQAMTYHHLGIVKQEQRLWAEAEGYYQLALEIDIQFNDRHSQAMTYHHLGRVKQEQRLWADSRAMRLEALRALVESGPDGHSLEIVLRGLSSLWRESGDAVIPRLVGDLIGQSSDEVRVLFDRFLDVLPQLGAEA